jgi:hypothetical protein
VPAACIAEITRRTALSTSARRFRRRSIAS